MNTINICVGHIPFPKEFAHYIDLMLTPVQIPMGAPTAYVPDKYYGEHGSSLSEYAQLFWLLEHLDEICSRYDYLRVVHYRRFVALERPPHALPASNNPWSSVVKQDELGDFENAFSRISRGELFNSKALFGRSVIMQYADAHILEDILNFAQYLSRQKILSDIGVAEFLSVNTLIPSCSIAVYRVGTFRFLFSLLRQAAAFMSSNTFQARIGYQRRAMGFLLERLNSYLLLVLMRNKKIPENFGHNIVISDSLQISLTQ